MSGQERCHLCFATFSPGEPVFDRDGEGGDLVHARCMMWVVGPPDRSGGKELPVGFTVVCTADCPEPSCVKPEHLELAVIDA